MVVEHYYSEQLYFVQQSCFNTQYDSGDEIHVHYLISQSTYQKMSIKRQELGAIVIKELCEKRL